MADFYATNHAKIVATPPQKIDGGDWGGAKRAHYDAYTALGTEAAASKIYAGQLNPGERFLGGKLVFSAMGASRTLKLGDSGDDDRFLVATDVSSAGSADLIASAGFGYRNDGLAPIDLYLTVAGGTLPADGTIKVLFNTVRI